MATKDERDDEKDTPKRGQKAATPAALTFPKTLYHADGRTTLAANADEERMWTKEGFTDSPEEGELYRQPGTTEPPIADPRPDYYVAPWSKAGREAREARETQDIKDARVASKAKG